MNFSLCAIVLFCYAVAVAAEVVEEEHEEVHHSSMRGLAAGAYSCIYGNGCVEMDNPGYFSFPPGDVFALGGGRPSTCYGEKSTATCAQRGYGVFLRQTQYTGGSTGSGNFYNLFVQSTPTPPTITADSSSSGNNCLNRYDNLSGDKKKCQQFPAKYSGPVRFLGFKCDIDQTKVEAANISYHVVTKPPANCPFLDVSCFNNYCYEDQGLSMEWENENGFALQDGLVRLEHSRTGKIDHITRCFDPEIHLGLLGSSTIYSDHFYVKDSLEHRKTICVRADNGALLAACYFGHSNAGNSDIISRMGSPWSKC